MTDITTRDLEDAGTGLSAPLPEPGDWEHRRGRLSAVVNADFVEKFGLLFAWIVVYFGFAIALPAFRQSETLLIILGSQSTQILVTLAVIVSLIGGEFDLSVANVLGGAAVMLAFFNSELGWPILVAIPLVLVFAVLFGLLNSFLVLRAGIPSIVATLGTGTFLTGVKSAVADDVEFVRTSDPNVILSAGTGPHPGPLKADADRTRYVFPTLLVSRPGAGTGTIAVTGWRPLDEYVAAVDRLAPELKFEAPPLDAEAALDVYGTLTQVELELLTARGPLPADTFRLELFNGSIHLTPNEARARGLHPIGASTT